MGLKFLFPFLPVFLLGFLPELALAASAGDTVIGNMMCNVSSWMTGNTGKGLATLGIIVIGLLALFNKITWGFAIIHVVGGVLIVEGAYIVNSLSAGGSGCP